MLSVRLDDTSRLGQTRIATNVDHRLIKCAKQQTQAAALQNGFINPLTKAQ